jgi:hypothetical protein
MTDAIETLGVPAALPTVPPPPNKGHWAQKPGTFGAIGKTGATGPTRPAANVNLSSLGVCANVTYNYSGVSRVSDVDISAPVLAGGTQSCPNGTFTAVTAQSATSSQ